MQECCENRTGVVEGLRVGLENGTSRGASGAELWRVCEEQASLRNDLVA